MTDHIRVCVTHMEISVAKTTCRKSFDLFTSNKNCVFRWYVPRPEFDTLKKIVSKLSVAARKENG